MLVGRLVKCLLVTESGTSRLLFALAGAACY